MTLMDLAMTKLVAPPLIVTKATQWLFPTRPPAVIIHNIGAKVCRVIIGTRSTVSISIVRLCVAEAVCCVSNRTAKENYSPCVAVALPVPVRW